MSLNVVGCRLRKIAATQDNVGKAFWAGGVGEGLDVPFKLTISTLN